MNIIKDKLILLQNILPKFANGFIINNINYECKLLGTKGTLDIGYIYRKKDNLLRKMPECDGTWPVEIPTKTIHWCEPSWHNGKRLSH